MSARVVVLAAVAVWLLYVSVELAKHVHAWPF